MSSRAIVHENEIFFLDIFIHAFILLSVLTAFFYIVIATNERRALNDKVKGAIDSSVSGLPTGISVQQQEHIKNTSKFIKDEFEAINDSDEIYNDSLRNYIIIIIAATFIVMVVVWFLLKYIESRNLNMFDLISFNLILFGVIGIMEYLFFINFASSFVPVKPSFLEEQLYEDLK